MVRQALDGVLFIDEAYSLARGGDGRPDFGPEAVEVLLERTEDRRHCMMVIVTGYLRLMESFLVSNPGLRSTDELEAIFTTSWPGTSTRWSLAAPGG